MRYQPIAVAALATALVGLSATAALAHGSMATPISRVLACYKENPEQPKSAACKAAVAAGGTQEFYDWMALRQANANGQSKSIIPDGKLCSAGVDEFKGLDLPRDDWPATTLTAGASYTFTFNATAPHKGTFALYITNSTYDPAKPLKWSNLQATPFLTATDPTLSGGQYLMPGKVPAGVTGRQLIYMIWQRSDSPEAFYSCSDVVLSGGSGATSSTTAPAPAKPATTKPTTTRPASKTPEPKRAKPHHHTVAHPSPKVSPLHARKTAADKPLALAAVSAVIITLVVAGLVILFPRRRRFFRRD